MDIETTKPVIAKGWVCSKCNTFWRDDTLAGSAKKMVCPFDRSLREHGREITLNLGEEIARASDNKT